MLAATRAQLSVPVPRGSVPGLCLTTQLFLLDRFGVHIAPHHAYQRQEETLILSPTEKRLFRADHQMSFHGLKIPKAAHRCFCWFPCCSDASELLVDRNVQAYGVHFISVCV